MFQVKKMLKRLANDNRYEEYDQDVLFVHFRPEFGSPDWEIMMKIIGERRRGVVAKPPDPWASHEDAVHFDYILLCSILALDEYFIEKLELREKGRTEVDAKMKRGDEYRTMELHIPHRFFIEYHMEVIRVYPEYHLAFVKASELSRILIQRKRSICEERRRKRRKSTSSDEMNRRRSKAQNENVLYECKSG